jgi:hypothetical protein
MTYRLAKSLETFRAQANAQWPSRSKASDGWIGDSAHASRSSDHNPWVKDGTTGVVTAFDLTNDPTHGVDDERIANSIKIDPRVKYLIWNRQIWNPAKGLSWRPYSGKNPHTKHLHISVRSEKKFYDSTAPWLLGEVTVAVSTPTPVSPERPLLKRGSKGQAVKELQALLGLEADGQFGVNTEAAVKAFQKANGLFQDGKVGEYTWDAIEAHPASVPSLPPQDNPSHGMARLQSVHGWPKRDAAAFIGRAQQESFPEIRTGVEGDKSESTGSAHGAWQWRMDREAAEKKFAADRGKPWTDWDTQIDFMVHELATSEKRAGAMLKAATTLEQSCEAAMAYCRPAGFSWDNPRAGHGWSNTLKNASTLFNK